MHFISRLAAVTAFAMTTIITFAAHGAASRNGVGPFLGRPGVTITNEGRLRVTHPRTGEVIISPRGPLYGRDTVQPSIQAKPVPGGLDIVAKYRNNTGSARSLGVLTLTCPTIDRQAQWYDFRRGTEIGAIDHKDGPIIRGYHPYPSDLYSPVAIIADDTLAIGASLLYNPLEYQHEVFTLVRAAGFDRTTPAAPGESEREWLWQVSFLLKGELAAGESRTYTLAVRFAQPRNAMSTLRPYADYFRETHGQVAYTKDPRPVKGYSFAQVHNQSSANPRGFTYGTRRPDMHGFAPWAETLRASVAASGYDRIMIWALSGLHRNDNLNYPPAYVTGADRFTPARRSRGQIRALRRENIDIGLWWGRSQQVMEGWHSDQIEFLDPQNRAHTRKAITELESAAVYSPSEIGLDAFAYLPVWEAAPWLERLQQTLPSARFITEPSSNDILHRMAPTWVNATEVTATNELANMVNPGHETWAGVRFDILQGRLGRPITQDERRNELERLIDLGFVPVLLGESPYPRNVNAPANDDSLAQDEPSDTAEPGPRKAEREIARPGWLRRQATHPPE